MLGLRRQEALVLAVAALLTAAAGALAELGGPDVATFAVSGLALAALATSVGDAVEQLGERMSAAATGILQSAFANLPELFVGLFALRAGLYDVVRAALVGSILANVLLVLGLAFVAGGVRHGVQRFGEPPKLFATLLLLAVAALAVPTLAARLHTPAASHERGLALTVSVVLLAVFAFSVPFRLRVMPDATAGPEKGLSHIWPLRTAVLVLALTSLGAALVSDWFVGVLEPATSSLGLSRAFTGLVVVAIASNAVENVVGIRLAFAGKADYAVSIIMNSPLQAALVLFPGLVLASFVVGPHPMTLVLPSLLLVVLAMSVVLATFVVFDGESSWLEGLVLVGLYGVIASAFWWG